MNPSISDTIVSCGVDYLTVTYKGPRSDNDLASFGRFVVGEQKELGEKWQDFRFSGYRGSMAGAAAFGVRWDSQIVRLSSTCAAEYWNQAYGLSTNVTRIDLQITVLPDEGPQERLAAHHQEMLDAPRGRGKPRKFKFWYGPHGPESAVFGSRKSDVFNRSYDKGLESGFEEFAGTLRYESELKRNVAKRCAFELDQSEDASALIAAKVGQFLVKSGKAFAKYFSRGKPLDPFSSAPRFSESNISLVNSQQAFSELESVYKGGLRNRRFAAFLTNSAKPGIHRLLDQGKSDEVLEALGLCIQNGKLAKAQDHRWANFRRYK